VAQSLPLLGIAYDPRSDVIEIVLDGLDHMVQRPREVFVDDAPPGELCLGVVDADGTLQIIQVHDPLLLPQRFAT
jgi:hypothetical protein